MSPPLVVELADGRVDASAVVVFGLLHLRPDDSLGSLGLLDFSTSKSPVENRDAECESSDFLVKRIPVCSFHLRRRIRKTKACVQSH